MKNNNIKKNETPIKLRQLIDDCENYLINFNSNNKEHSILSFFSSNIFVKEFDSESAMFFSLSERGSEGQVFL